MKNITLLICVCCIWSCTAYSQDNYRPSIKGYLNREHVYFKGIHKELQQEIACLDVIQEVYAFFKIDSNGVVFDLNVIELPDQSGAAILKQYVRKLIQTTNHKWLLAEKEGRKIGSDEMLYRFDFTKASLDMAERTEKENKLFEYYIKEGYKNETIRRFDDSKSKRIISILY